MSSQKKRSNEPCDRCGAIVIAPVAGDAKVYCANCRSKTNPADSAKKDAARPENPVKLSAEDILTVTCQLCRSSLLVNESKVGTKVICSDCHSEVLVQRPKSRSKGKHGRPSPKTNQPLFDPDAELSLEAPVERPKVDQSVGLDEDTEDLLSAPLPQVDPLSTLDDESIDLADGDSLPDDDQTLTRRQRYEQIQQRAISEGREKKRARARGKKVAKKSGSERTESAADSDDLNSRKQKRRRKRKGRRGEKRSPSWLKPAFGWLRYRAMIIGWVLSAGCMSAMYFAGADWSPFDLLDRGYGTLTREPLVLDIWLIAKSALLAVGSLCLYFLCGRSFAMNAEMDHEAEDESENPQQPESSRVFTTMHFAMAWWLAGLPFLYFSILILPAQFLIVSPLLVGSWLNRSVWKFVRADGLIHADRQQETRRLWRKFYSVQFVAAAIAILPVLMIRTGGVPCVIGCFLVGGIMIGMAGICGRHCRELSESLEPSA